jgi:hypothetical protein
MSCKTLMVYVDLDGKLDSRVRIAAELAGRFDAALIGISAWSPQPAYIANSGVIESVPEEVDLQVMSGLLKSRGDEFRAVAGLEARRVDWRTALELPSEFILREARAADLLVAGGLRHPVLRDP